MTRRFRVTIGGVTYNVDVEELGQAAPGPGQAGAAQAAAGPAGGAAVSAGPAAAAQVGTAAHGAFASTAPAGTASAAAFGPAAPAAAGIAGNGAAPATAPAGSFPAQAPSAAPAATPASGSPVGEGQAVCAPLPGMIVDVKVTVGQQVAAGDVVAVLEAMKMENDITSPYAGTVKQVLVSKGASVSMNDPLVVIG